MFSTYRDQIAKRLLAIVPMLLACSAKSASKAEQNPAGLKQPILDHVQADTSSQLTSKTPFASEVEARQLLDRLFRERGYRIVNDVEFWEDTIEVTLDGYDPQLKVGYEYIAEREANLDLSAGEMRSLQNSSTIFVSSPTSLDELESRAHTFLRERVRPQPPK